ncbi:hypothetical protein [Neisseria sp. Ec49-e6-T10]
MSHAFENKELVIKGSRQVWRGESGNVLFEFNPPSKNVPQWRGYPVYEK